MLSALLELVHRGFERQPDPPAAVTVAVCLLALFVVLQNRTWRYTRGFITIAHEGGHALAAVLTGRRLSGIRLHSDSSGLTLSRGRPTGPGMVITGLAGYVTPPLLGFAAAALLASGRVTALLWISLALLPLILIMIRNAFGLISVLSAMALLALVSWYASPAVQGAFGYLFAWFLLLGGARAVLELQGSRRRGLARNSDADQIARLTRVPALVWVALFVAVAGFSLLIGGRWLFAPALVH